MQGDFLLSDLQAKLVEVEQAAQVIQQQLEAQRSIDQLFEGPFPTEMYAENIGALYPGKYPDYGYNPQRPHGNECCCPMCDPAPPGWYERVRD